LKTVLCEKSLKCERAFTFTKKKKRKEKKKLGNISTRSGKLYLAIYLVIKIYTSKPSPDKKM